MINILGIVIAKRSELTNREDYFFNEGYHVGKQSVKSSKRISPRTGLPVRKYTKRK
jgi:hypothetical protein